MKKSFKRVISILSAAALSSSIAVPVVFADSALTAVNGATADTIGDAVASVVTESGKFDYSVLPACDRTEINERMLAGAPYSDDAALYAAYQKALEYTTQVDRDKYGVEIIEDFSNLDANWTKSSPEPYIGSPGTIDTSILRNLNISGNETSFMEVWGAPFGNGGNQWIARDLNDPYCIVSGYMYYSNINGMPKVYYSIKGNSENNYGIGNGGDDGEYRYNDGTSWGNNIAENDNAWHKVEFDGLTEPGKIKGYLDGQLLFTVEDTMKSLKVGCLDSNNDGYYIFCMDNISVATSKPEGELMDIFNANPVTELSLGNMFAVMGKDKDLFESLPGCDRTKVVSILEAARPYDDAVALATAYQSALETATGVDTSQYNVLWTEDFSNYSTDNWTVTGTLHGGAIGTDSMLGIARKSLNITDESYSAGFVGASLISNNVNYIKRTVSEPNSIVTAYFNDNANDTVNSFYNIKVNDHTWIGCSGGDNQYSYEANAGVALTGVTKGNNAWHKVVFDGTTDPSVTAIYLDGQKIAESSEKIVYVQMGNQWNNPGYDVVWMDHVSVAAPKTGVVTEVAASSDLNSDAAVGYKAVFDITGSTIVKGCDWNITAAGSESSAAASSILGDGTGTTVTGGSVAFGLIVELAAEDAAKKDDLQVTATLK